MIDQSPDKEIGEDGKPVLFSCPNCPQKFESKATLLTHQQKFCKGSKYGEAQIQKLMKEAVRDKMKRAF